MLHLAIAAGLIFGLIVGLGAAATGNEWLHAIANGSAPFGVVFMNAIRMIVIPLIITVIFTSIANLGDPRKLGRIGLQTMAFYWITLIPAIAIGMATMKFGLQFVGEIRMPQTAVTQVPELQSMVDFLVSLVPANPFAAASNGAILPLIVFTALLAAATGTLPVKNRERLINIADDISKALIKLVWWILYTAPIGVFGLTAPVTAKLGWDLVQSLGIFITCVFIGLLIFLVLVTLPLVYFAAGIGPLRYLKSTFGAMSVAASTTSTAAAIPVSLEETTKNLKVSTTIAAVGAAMLATFLVSLTVAPVPSSGVVTMAPALETVGIPVAGIALMLGIDRIPDMMRSAINVLAQISTAVLINRWNSDTGDSPEKVVSVQNPESG
jgi:Na+/H+-dicarboxylate symporter